jgi:hypothetical protein
LPDSLTQHRSWSVDRVSWSRLHFPKSLDAEGSEVGDKGEPVGHSDLSAEATGLFLAEKRLWDD